MPHRRLTATGYAILGYLSITPMSGYDLHTAIEHSIAQFWPISRSQVYKELPRLESGGHILGTKVTQEHLPDKRVYEITNSGTAALDEWLACGDLPPRAPRIPELLKLFFGHRIDGDVIREMLNSARHAEMRSIARFEEILAQLDAFPEARYVRATASYGLVSAQAYVEWVDETLNLLDDVSSEPSIDFDPLEVIRRIPPRPRADS